MGPSANFLLAFFVSGGFPLRWLCRVLRANASSGTVCLPHPTPTPTPFVPVDPGTKGREPNPWRPGEPSFPGTSAAAIVKSMASWQRG